MPQREYTVKHVKPNIDKETGEQRVDNYGNKKYYVLFDGEDENVPLSAKTEPKAGDVKYGEIVQGEYGKYFKGAKNPNASFGGGGSKYDGDGQKQGMAIKLAGEYVNKFLDKVSPKDYAKAIEPYATAIYNLHLDKVEAPKSWEEMRVKKEQIQARIAEEKPVAVTANGDYDVQVDEIDDTPIDLKDIPF